jgi:hypothetical protein
MAGRTLKNSIDYKGLVDIRRPRWMAAPRNEVAYSVREKLLQTILSYIRI